MTSVDIPTNLRDTASKVREVLAALDTSLDQAGFNSALPSYREMVALLVNQRLYAARSGLTEPEAIYSEITERAAAICGVLTSYVEALRPLVALGVLGEAAAETEPASPADPAEAAILAALDAAGGSATATRLHSTLKIDRAALTALAATLVAKGIISRRDSGGREAYRRLSS